MRKLKFHNLGSSQLEIISTPLLENLSSLVQSSISEIRKTTIVLLCQADIGSLLSHARKSAVGWSGPARRVTDEL